MCQAAAATRLLEAERAGTSRAPPGWREAGEKRHASGEEHGEQQDTRVEGQRKRNDRLRDDEDDPGAEPAGHHREQRKRGCLEREQPDDLRSRRAEREANRKLTCAFRRAGKLQVGDVRAADRQHGERHAQHHHDGQQNLERAVVRPVGEGAGFGARTAS